MYPPQIRPRKKVNYVTEQKKNVYIELIMSLKISIHKFNLCFIEGKRNNFQILIKRREYV